MLLHLVLTGVGSNPTLIKLNIFLDRTGLVVVLSRFERAT